MQIGTQLIVAYPFTAEGEGELTVAQGTVVTVQQTENEHNPGWLLVQSADGRSGYVPVDFLKEMMSENPPQSDFKQKAHSRMSVVMPPAMQTQYSTQEISFVNSASGQTPLIVTDACTQPFR